MSAAPTLEEFLAEAEAFLSARWPRKEAATSSAFVWGEGSDEMKVFQEPEPEEEAEQMAAVRAWRKALWDNGLAWITGPPELGGRGLSAKHERAFESLSRRYAVPGDSMLTVSLGMIAPTIHRHGTPEQQARWLPLLRSGEKISCQLFSEPNAGSDLAGIATKAERDGDGWRLNGQKVWTSGAHLADVGEIICRTSDGPRHHNLTAFMIDMRAPGVEVRPLRQMTGGAAFNEVFLTDVWVADSDRIDEVGAGWRVALSTLGFERTAMGHSSFGGVGLLRTDRLVGMLRHTGKDQDPVSRQDFADVVVHLRAARYLQSRTAAMAKAGQMPAPALSMNKICLSDNFRRLSDFAVKTLGPKVTADTGEWGTYAWTSVLLGTPGYRLGGGTDQVLKNILAERALGLPKPTGSGGTAP